MIKLENVEHLGDSQDVTGRKKKFKTTIDGKEYIVKLGYRNYEIFAELIAERLGQQAGISMAHYDVCMANGEIGLITPSFLDPTKKETIVSAEELLRKCNLQENTIENITKALTQLGYGIQEVEEIEKELFKRWIFYGLIMESDKNGSNISFITDENGSIRLSPDYDNSTMGRLNENVDQLIESMRFGTDAYTLTEHIHSAFKPTEDLDDEYLNSYRTYTSKKTIPEEMLQAFKDISVDKAIEEVEMDNQITIPWSISFWLNKAINTRKEDIFTTYYVMENKKRTSS